MSSLHAPDRQATRQQKLQSQILTTVKWRGSRPVLVRLDALAAGRWSISGHSRGSHQIRHPVRHRGDAFESAWRVFLAKRTEADFDEYRKHRAWTAWKYAMWDSGCKLPTQVASGQSRCFCGAVIDIKGMSQHVHIAHMKAA
jgi:hypothetical protein